MNLPLTRAPTLTTTANLGDLFVFRYNGAKWLEVGRNLALTLSHNIMFALVESGSITKMLNGNKGIQIGDLKYPRAIYTLWTEAERNAIGIYTVEYDDSNKKDENGISIQINLMHLMVITQQVMVLQLQKHTLILTWYSKMMKIDEIYQMLSDGEVKMKVLKQI